MRCQSVTGLEPLVTYAIMGLMPKTKTLPELIARAGHTHRTLGEKTGLHYTYFSKMARGQRSPSLERSKIIAKALKVSLDVLQKACAKGIE